MVPDLLKMFDILFQIFKLLRVTWGKIKQLFGLAAFLVVVPHSINSAAQNIEDA